MLNLYKLHIFATVASRGSFSGAAQQLYLTQPAVSQHIQSLETALGTRLFERGANGVRLTPAGETLLDYTGRILELVAEAERSVLAAAQNTTGLLQVGATAAAAVYLLPGWLQHFARRYPEITVSLATGTTPQLARQVVAKQLDLALVEGELQPEPPLQYLELRPQAWFVVVGPDHGWWDRESVALAELNNEPLITRPQGTRTRTWIDRILDEYKVRPRVVAEFDNPEAIKQAVAGGMGVALLPDFVFQQELEAGRLRALNVEDAPLQRILKLLWVDNMPFKPVTHAFLGYLSDHFPQVKSLLPGS